MPMLGSERDDALRELGRMAEARREDAGMTLEDVYDRTRIRLEYLRGIEDGDYEGFPEPVYVKGFIRTYLRLIGGEDLLPDFVAQLDRTRPQKEPTAALMGNGSFPKGFKPASHIWLFLALLTALAGTLGYVGYAISQGKLDFQEWRWPNFAQTNGTASRDEHPVLSDDVASSDVALASMDVSVASAEPTPAPAPKPRPSLEIRAQRQDVWLQVDIGSDVVYSRTLRQGDAVSWDLPAQARVRFGRANAAQVILNGRDLGIVSARGTFIYQPDGTARRATK